MEGAMGAFELIDDLEGVFQSLEMEEFMSAEDDDLDAITYDRCIQCDVPMTVKTNNQYVCPRCGLLREDVEVSDMNTITSNMNYNTMSSGLRCIGQNSHRYQTILRSQASSSTSPDVHIQNILFAFNYKIGKEGAVPKEILLNVCDQFKHARQEGTIYRGAILRAILAAMTYYECLRYKYLFRPCDIYRWFNVDSQTYSKGDKKVREMLDHGFLSEDLREINAEDSYLHAYANKIEFPEEHMAFLVEVMKFVTDHKILNPNAKSSTRALCVLHLYMVATNYSIKPDQFRVLFHCNYGTIRTITLELFHASDQLVPIFEFHDIPYDCLKSLKEKSKKAVVKRLAKSRVVMLGPA